MSGNDGGGTPTYSYKVQGADDSTYSGSVPTSAGNYIVRASVPETDNYLAGTATANFTIKQPLLTVTIDFRISMESPADVDPITIYYVSGESWAQAKTNHSENSDENFKILPNAVQYMAAGLNEYYLKAGYGTGGYIPPNDIINPSLYQYHFYKKPGD